MSALCTRAASGLTIRDVLCHTISLEPHPITQRPLLLAERCSAARTNRYEFNWELLPLARAIDNAHERPVCRFLPRMSVGHGVVHGLRRLMVRESNIRNDFEPFPPDPHLLRAPPGYGARPKRADRKVAQPHDS